MTNYRRRNCTGHVVNDTINRWPLDEIGILDGNCSFNVGVSIITNINNNHRLNTINKKELPL